MKTALIILCALLSVKVSAHTEINDSIKAKQHSEVVVEANMQPITVTGKRVAVIYIDVSPIRDDSGLRQLQSSNIGP